jgi:lipid A disaccharide synthetase|tara:strand:- start:1242 stop:1391 length:150 start_codon:yes stop_codon:yes gene_type:complete
MEDYVEFIKSQERENVVNEILDLKLQKKQTQEMKERIQKLQQRLTDLTK